MTKREGFSPRAAARAVLMVWLFRVGAGLAVSYPTARVVGVFIPPAFPTSDAALFEPGGLYAVEAVRLGGRAITASLEGSGFVFLLGSIAACFPLAIALTGLLHPDESVGRLARRAAEAMPSLVVLGGTFALLQTIGMAIVAGGIATFSGSLDAVMDEPLADICVWLVALAATLPVVGIGLIHDLARAAVLRHETRARGAMFAALGVVRRMPRIVVARWFFPAIAGVGLVGVAAFVSGALDVSRPGAARVAGVFMLHQATVLGLVVLRLFWLGEALRLVGPPLPRPPLTTDQTRPWPGGTPERSDELDDPTQDPVA
jgi:hypothetical protein